MRNFYVAVRAKPRIRAMTEEDAVRIVRGMLSETLRSEAIVYVDGATDEQILQPQSTKMGAR